MLEVGLGGRLDATNIVDSDISIITSIGIDHTEFLGNTIDSIALEKAGVMRSFKTSIYAQQNPPAALLKYAKNKSVNLLIHNNDYSVLKRASGWTLKSKSLTIDNIPNLKMIGDYQYNYAAASILALNEVLPESLSDHQEIKKSLSNTEIPGRFQYLSKSPDIILDVAHNEDAAKSLSENIKNIGKNKVNVVLGILADKDVYSIVDPFISLVNHWYIGTINNERGMNADEIKYRINSIYKNKLSTSTFSSISSAFNVAKSEQTLDSTLLVFGSFYTVAEALNANLQHQQNKNVL